jgi:cytochrome d ubiquinol oxidase subunit I
MDTSLVDWSRAQFALTAIYHWFFVPLTLGLSFIIAFMESIYVKTGNEQWKKITKFWMTLFGVNFAIGVATGIILEFEFGTNWSKYSWFVGDIFGAPLAVEGIMAFFLESTFIAVMFFGWNKVSKKFHLASTWLTAIGANLSALWILVANSWMQYPAGMRFNPDTARNEMLNFWEVLFSPVAINKFLHTVTSGYVLSAVFVIGISSYYLLKKKNLFLAKRSILIASVFGIIMTVYIIVSGDSSARLMAHYQPVKFAAMENLYEGKTNAPLVAFGVLKTDQNNTLPREEFLTKIEIPNFLSYMTFLKSDSFVPGISDLVNGNEEQGIIPVQKKIDKGKKAIRALEDYKANKKEGNNAGAEAALKELNDNFDYFGYGYLDSPAEVIPPVKATFYSFRLMVGLGFWFLILFIFALVYLSKNKIEKRKWLLYSALFSIPLAYLATQLGWVVAEVGRQPWIIQDLMPTKAAVSNISTNSVKLTFFLFAVTFTVLLIANIKIILKQIKKGLNEGGNN